MSDWAPAVCGVGQPGHTCGQVAPHVIAVHLQADVWDDDVSTPGVVYLCGYHATTPPADWKPQR